MKTIKQNCQNEIIINKSKFITFLIRIESVEDIEHNMALIKKDYKDATHYCYAYTLDNIKRFGDDGEPGGTAGMPILNVLDNNKLNNILCVVVRYFGGIKLGAGGLVRAYTKAVTSCLDKCETKELKEHYKIKITFSYDTVKDIDYILKEYHIIEKQFAEVITYLLYIETDDNIIEKIKTLSNIELLGKIVI